jgi:hypothetical protein
MSTQEKSIAKTATSGADVLPDYAPVPQSAYGPALNQQGYYVGRVERNLYWVTDGSYQSAFLTTKDGVVLFDAPPSIGHQETRRLLQRDRMTTRPSLDRTRPSLTVVRSRSAIELVWHGANHTSDNIYVHFPDHDALMLVDIVNSGCVRVYNLNLTEDDHQ